MGRLERVDSAEVQALRSMAAQLDVKASNAMLWKVYGEALERLTSDGDEDTDLADLVERLRSPARDTPAG